MITDLIIFFIGFASGSFIIWFVRQREFDSLKASEDELKKNFSDLSNEVLLESQKSFFFSHLISFLICYS